MERRALGKGISALIPEKEVSESSQKKNEVLFVQTDTIKPNPFQPLVVEKVEPPPGAKKRVEQAAKKEESGPGTLLEKIDLNAFKLVAVVWGIPNPRAMVEEAGGKGYILTVGTRIGKNKGQVTKINSTGVVVSEKYEDSDGKAKTREVPLRLYTD